MFLHIIKTTVFSISILLSTQANAIELNLNLIDNSALTMLTDSDWDLLRATAKEALNNSPDGNSHVWKNNDTSNAGVITILSTDESNGNVCRNTRFINTAGNLTSTTLVNLCKEEDKWVEESLRSTTTTENSLSSSSPSVMLNDTLDASTEITTKTLGKTSEYCRELFQNIEDLKGKPARRSVAIDLHKAECLR
ncbi:MAG: hypothetical protein HRT92_00685 [Piscirickettsiaceae bacterium]|nr:hypothetical protein [Piscirickettsiaceae bacterium]